VIAVGTAIVSYMEPHAGLEREFNRWYEGDHFPAAVLAGPGVFAGGRFVAPRGGKELRPPAGTLFGPVDRGSFFSVAWVAPGAQAGWEDWVATRMEELTAEGRLFAGRDHLHTAIYDYVAEVGAPEAVYALDRCFPGVAVVAVRATDDAATTFARALVGDAVPLAVVLRQRRLVLSVLGDDAVTDPASHALVLAFLDGFVDGDVAATWRARIEPHLRGNDVRYAGPFVRTVPGTDTYVDDL
jgi:hypothetical protein